MQHPAIDLLARASEATGSRRTALAVAGAIVFGADAVTVRSRPESNQRASPREAAFPRKGGRFIIAAGPQRTDKVRRIADDLRIEIIAKNGGAPKTVLRDNNDVPNKPNGDHLRVTPFSAKVGDEVHIVARNEVGGASSSTKFGCLHRGARGHSQGHRPHLLQRVPARRQSN